MANTGEVNLFVGTQKGTYVARSRKRRTSWTVEGPAQVGAAVYHVASDPRTPGHVYALANNPFWGPVLYRSTDSGRRWKEMATPGLDRRKARGGSPPGLQGGLAVRNLWHLEPGRADSPGQLFVGLDPHGLFRSEDGGRSWEATEGIARHPTRPQWAAGAGGACLHTIILDPERANRMYVGLSAAGTFRSDDGGGAWIPMNRGVKVSFLPEPNPEVGQCVHHFALDPEDSRIVYRQDHDGIYLSEDAMENWMHVGRALPHDFGFVVATARALPGGAIFAPLISAGERFVDGHRLQLQWFDRRRRSFRPMIRRSPWVGEFGMHREGLATDACDPAGIYLGTTSGQVVFSPNGGGSWSEIPYRFPAIHSVATGPAG